MSSRSAASAGRASVLPRWSIGRRLVLWYTASAILLILLAGQFLDRRLEALIEQQVDRSLAEKVHIVQKLLIESPLDIAKIRHEVEVEWGHNVYAGVWLRVYDPANGAVIAQTPGLPAFAGPSRMPRPGPADAELGNAAEVYGPDGAPYRVIAAVAPTATGPGTSGRPLVWEVHAVLTYAREAELLARYRRELVMVLLLAGLAAVPLGFVIARSGLAAVNRMSEQVQDLSSATLHRRLSLERLPTELVDLAGVFNATLDRLQDSFERLSRFSSDLAHELRTPLANLRGEVEVTLSRPRSDERYREVLESALEECERLNDIVERMLFLARAENTQEPVTRAPLHLAAELERVRDYFEAAAQESGISVTVEASPDLVAPLDPVLFNRAMANLVANSLEHTPPGGRVILAANPSPAGGLAVSVSDTGRGIPAEHVQRVFDRFHRVDPSRSTARGGVGLGLAIVASIARLHGGHAEAESQPGQGTTVRLVLPGGQVEPGAWARPVQRPLT